MQRVGILLSVMLLVFGISLSAEATLVDMGDGTIYDTDRELSWLKDANMAGGLMPWTVANAWAASLNTSPGFAGFTNWRLPTTTQPDAACSQQGDIPVQGSGVNCVNSEMGHLYYTELGNPADGPLGNAGPFTNFHTESYWSGTEYAPNPDHVWRFYFDYGYQSTGFKTDTLAALAVRPGHRSTGPATPVPAADTAGLIVMTLAGLVIYGLRLNMKKT